MQIRRRKKINEIEVTLEKEGVTTGETCGFKIVFLERQVSVDCRAVCSLALFPDFCIFIFF